MRRAAAVVLLVGAAVAEDVRTPGEQVLAELAAARAEGPIDGAVALLGEVGALIRWPASAAEADALLRAAGAATRDERPAVQAAALRALAAAGAPAGAAYVEPFLRSLKEADEPAVVLAAVQAAGRLRVTSLVPSLLKLARKSRSLTVADQALEALGRFRDAPPSVRADVAGKVLDVCRALTRKTSRWTRLRAPGLRALQRLIGRRLNTVQHFADWWAVASKRPDPFSAAAD